MSPRVPLDPVVSVVLFSVPPVTSSIPVCTVRVPFDTVKSLPDPNIMLLAAPTVHAPTIEPGVAGAPVVKLLDFNVPFEISNVP